MTLGWRARLAATLLALWITGADEARAQDRPIAVKATVGWAGFVDDATIDHAVYGGGARISLTPRVSVGPEVVYMVGPDADRDLFVLGSIWIDLLAPRPDGRSRPTSCSAAATWAIATSSGRGPYPWTHEGSFTAGGGARVRVGDRVYVGGDVRIGWELHLRATAHVGVAWPRAEAAGRASCRGDPLRYPVPAMSGRDADLGPGAAAVLSGWGRWPVVPATNCSRRISPPLTRDANLTRGLGRSYGDASLPAAAGARVAGSRLADRVIAFDPDTGVLRAEAGLTLRDINRTFLPRGWFVPVTPGTSFVTLGGAVASDVHGKNHHSAGTFGRHVRRLRLRVGTGAIVETSPEIEPDLFDATVGGMGLTGHMLDVEVALRRVPSHVDRRRDRVRAGSRGAARHAARGRPGPGRTRWRGWTRSAPAAAAAASSTAAAGPRADEAGGRAAGLAARDQPSRWRCRTGRCRRSACAGSTRRCCCATGAA